MEIMSNAILILGESGTGKSSALSTLNPKETFILNVLDKPLPFRGFKKNYISIKGWDDMEGNYYATDQYEKIKRVIEMINNNRPEIKNLILDDWQYIMAHAFMRRCKERGYDKFTEIGHDAWDIVERLGRLREDLNAFVLTHSEANDKGKMKIKTIGKMIDDKITLEGMFTVVLQTEISDSGYHFITQGDINHIAKSPRGMFDDLRIPNDLEFVKQKINSYYHGNI